MLLRPLWRAIVPGSHGGVVLSTEHSQGGDAFSSPALRERAAAKVKGLQAGVS